MQSCVQREEVVLELHAVLLPRHTVYYCDLDGSSQPIGLWADTYTVAGINFISDQIVDATGPLENGPLTITMQHEPPSYSCTTTWPTDATGPLVAAIPAGISPVHVSLGSIGLLADYNYFVWIHSD